MKGCRAKARPPHRAVPAGCGRAPCPRARGCHLCTQPRRRARTRPTLSPSLCRCSGWGCGSARARLPGTRLCWGGGRGRDGRVAGTPPLACDGHRLVEPQPEMGQAAPPAQDGLAAAVGSTAGLPRRTQQQDTKNPPPRHLGRGGPPSGGAGEQGITPPRCCDSLVSRARTSVLLPARDGPGGGRAWRAESTSQGISGLSAPWRPQPQPSGHLHRAGHTRARKQVWAKPESSPGN